jgi:hypothetical protein
VSLERRINEAVVSSTVRASALAAVRTFWSATSTMYYCLFSAKRHQRTSGKQSGRR